MGVRDAWCVDLASVRMFGVQNQRGIFKVGRWEAGGRIVSKKCGGRKREKKICSSNSD